MTIFFVLLAILLLGVLITVHEFGHFAASRMCGIAVKEFSIGFGPKLLQWKSKKHDTVFSIRPIPLGGYCMFYGDTDDDPDGTKAKDDPRNYNNAPVWKRMISVFAGPAMNFVLAFVAAIVFASAYGQTIATPLRSEISVVNEQSPAEAAGLMPGDVFVSIDGMDAIGLSTAEVSTAIGTAGADGTVVLEVERNGEIVALTVMPEFSEADNRVMIGISFQQMLAPLASGQVVPAAWNLCVNASTAIVDALGKLFTTGEGLNQTAGPVGVVQIVAEQTRQGGMEIFLYYMVVISINLGLMNLLPIPGLDGSRLVFMLIEAVRRKPVSQKIESVIHLCGYAFLFCFMLFFTFKDVVRIFQ